MDEMFVRLDDEPSGVRGGFICPASRAAGWTTGWIEGKPTKCTDLREASFGRPHEYATIVPLI
jgi:hypothetical protein